MVHVGVDVWTINPAFTRESEDVIFLIAFRMSARRRNVLQSIIPDDSIGRFRHQDCAVAVWHAVQCAACRRKTSIIVANRSVRHSQTPV